MEYLVWQSDDVGNSCMLSTIQGMEDSWRLKESVPLGGEIPDDAFFPMSDRHPKDIKLTDCLINMDSAIIVSDALKSFLETLDLGRVEFLRVKIVNHKGSVASDSYYIVNPVGAQDCLDADASKAKYNSIIPTDIDFVKTIVLRDNCVDPDVKVFRLANFQSPVLVRSDVAEAIAAQPFKGNYFEPLDEYEG